MKRADGVDGRHWIVQSEIEWRTPSSQMFLHDISASRASAFVMLAFVAVLAVVLIVWTPPDVVVPLWLVLLIILVLLFFPLRWLLNRPWTIVAATGDDQNGNPTEMWQGSVRGWYKAYQQERQVSRSIEVSGAPPGEGPLTQVIKVDTEETSVKPEG